MNERTPCADNRTIKTEWTPSEVTEVFKKYELPITEEKAQKLCVFGAFLQEKNASVNLTAITEKGEIILKHFVDSAKAARFIPEGADLVDVGCGAGFPSVVLKILRDDVTVTCVDSVGKKTEFVREVAARTGVDCRVLHMRAEELAEKNREGFSVACARAVAPLPTLLEYLAPLVKKGGKIVALKGASGEQERDAAKPARVEFGLDVPITVDFSLGGDRRTILVYEKIASTPAKYPRGQNAPRKAPILK